MKWLSKWSWNLKDPLLISWVWVYDEYITAPYSGALQIFTKPLASDGHQYQTLHARLWTLCTGHPIPFTTPPIHHPSTTHLPTPTDNFFAKNPKSIPACGILLTITQFINVGSITLDGLSYGTFSKKWVRVHKIRIHKIKPRCDIIWWK